MEHFIVYCCPNRKCVRRTKSRTLYCCPACVRADNKNDYAKKHNTDCDERQNVYDYMIIDHSSCLH